MSDVWQIRMVDRETRDIIKEKARVSGVTVGQYLNLKFTDRPSQGDSSEKNRVIPNMSSRTHERLKNLAIKRGERMSDTIEYLINCQERVNFEGLFNEMQSVVKKWDK